MKQERGLIAPTALVVILVIVLVAIAGYVVMNPQVLQAPSDAPSGIGTMSEDTEAGRMAASEPVIAWRYADLGETDGIPYTNVFVSVNGKEYDAGKVEGSCSEIGTGGGIDGKGLLPGELSATQCWFAGGGYEIGVFAHEDGGVDILKGYLSEGEAGAGMFRGDFTGLYTIP
jgi:hypothetical protein